jgi:hypothetical protein
VTHGGEQHPPGSAAIREQTTQSHDGASSRAGAVGGGVSVAEGATAVPFVVEEM